MTETWNHDCHARFSIAQKHVGITLHLDRQTCRCRSGNGPLTLGIMNIMIIRNTKPVRVTSFRKTCCVLYSPNAYGGFCILNEWWEEPKPWKNSIQQSVWKLYLSHGHEQTRDLPTYPIHPNPNMASEKIFWPPKTYLKITKPQDVLECQCILHHPIYVFLTPPCCRQVGKENPLNPAKKLKFHHMKSWCG